IAGIVGFVLAWIFGSGILFSIAAVILGFLGRKKEPAAKGMWLTGIILGFVGILIAVIFIIFWIIAIVALSTSGYYTY
ncbi:hypothetical protein ACC691_40180, partial [Rhizobium johnstonii]|uniref:hypothetical protein n=1 Tax=Rhizobium johnstonii TaxID=3019933 RepID=UPI003F9E431B